MSLTTAFCVGRLDAGPPVAADTPLASDNDNPAPIIGTTLVLSFRFELLFAFNMTGHRGNLAKGNRARRHSHARAVLTAEVLGREGEGEENRLDPGAPSKRSIGSSCS